MHINQIHAQTVPAKALEARKVFLSGPIGCGKTTIAIALAEHHTGVEYSSSSVDIQRINCAEITIDDVRRLIQELRYCAFDQRAKCKAYILDELHVLPDKCEKALLIPIEEDTHNLWVGCTNLPHKVSPALLSRFSLHLSFAAPTVEAITKILVEDQGMNPADATKVAKNCNGDLRRALSGSTDATDYDTETLNIRDAGHLMQLAMRDPYQIQASLLNMYFKTPEKHTILCGNLSTANNVVAAHQLVSLARRAGVVK